MFEIILIQTVKMDSYYRFAEIKVFPYTYQFANESNKPKLLFDFDYFEKSMEFRFEVINAQQYIIRIPRVKYNTVTFSLFVLYRFPTA